MIGHLTHLHDETENVGVVIEQNTLGDIGLKLSGAVIHNATCKIVLLLAEELSINIDLLSRQFHCR